jgi:hypothetical protein
VVPLLGLDVPREIVRHAAKRLGGRRSTCQDTLSPDSQFRMPSHTPASEVVLSFRFSCPVRT